MYKRTLTIDVNRPEHLLSELSVGQNSAFLLSIKGVPESVARVTFNRFEIGKDDGLEFVATNEHGVWIVAIRAGFFTDADNYQYEVECLVGDELFWSGRGLLHVMPTRTTAMPVDVGPTGPRGEKGEKGEVGATGPKGEDGKDGAVGATGPRGEKGEKGERGATGPTGPTGAQGVKGEQGERGYKGEKGDTGPKGDIGPTGPQGLRGLKGDTGLRGETGPTGATGAQGIQGKQGEQGPTGPQGATGPEGKSGKDGAIGPTGAKGEKGEQGPRGLQGAQGVTGPQGLKGEQGERGPQGIQGERGLQGKEGPTGPRGEKGEQGEPFKIYKSYASIDEMVADFANESVPLRGFVVIASGTDKPDNGKLYLKEENGYSFIVDLSGAEGIQGPKGEKGDTGPRGERGEQGFQGVKGDTGPRGFQGEKGEKGEPGRDGVDGKDGEKGEKGDIGPTGPQGDKMRFSDLSFEERQELRGEIGPMGATGPTGPQGLKGETGADGKAGINGRDGETGPTGPTGATGAKGEVGPTGAQGEKGATGAVGPTGATGPTGAKMTFADLSFDERQELRGETGPQGLQGPTGPTGPQGEKGTDGKDGVDGIQGPTGPIGPTGPRGPAGGPTGPTGATGATGPVSEKTTLLVNAKDTQRVNSALIAETDIGWAPEVITEQYLSDNPPYAANIINEYELIFTPCEDQPDIASRKFYYYVSIKYTQTFTNTTPHRTYVYIDEYLNSPDNRPIYVSDGLGKPVDINQLAEVFNGSRGRYVGNITATVIDSTSIQFKFQQPDAWLCSGTLDVTFKFESGHENLITKKIEKIITDRNFAELLGAKIKVIRNREPEDDDYDFESGENTLYLSIDCSVDGKVTFYGYENGGGFYPIASFGGNSESGSGEGGGGEEGGGISQMMVETTHADLVSLRDNGELVPGMRYRITDYVTYSAQSYTESMQNPFDVIVTADSHDRLNEVASAARHDGDTYFPETTKFEAWKIWYCLDNDATRFAWADVDSGMGVIYRMIDEFNNDVPYDFKNIKMGSSHHPGERYFTFDSGLVTRQDEDGNDYDTHEDTSLVSGLVYNNRIEPRRDKFNSETERFVLNANMFVGEGECHDNIFEANCADNHFNCGCVGNHFGTKCYKNFLDYDCSFNTFGSDCSNNTLSNSCVSNTFGNSCYSNTLGGHIIRCSFGSGCSQNNIPMGCRALTLQNDVRGLNLILDDIEGNIIYYRNVEFKSGLRDVTIEDTRGDMTYKYKVFKPKDSVEVSVVSPTPEVEEEEGEE